MPNMDTVTTSEAAGILGLGTRQMNRLIIRGELVPLKKLPGLRGTYIFDRAYISSLAPAVPTSPEVVGTAGVSSHIPVTAPAKGAEK